MAGDEGPGSSTTELEGRAARGGLWATVENAVSRGLVLLRYVAVARLLTPDQVGLFTFGALALSAVTRFSSIGINPAIIAQDGDLDRQLEAAFTLQIARNLLLATLLYVGAPVAATVFGDPRAVRLVRLIALVPLVDTIENPATVVFRQELNFRRRAVFRISGVLANALVAVGLAYYTRSVDALVAGVLAGAAVHTLVSHVIVPRHPVPSLDTAQMRRLLDYGKWLTGNSMVKWLADEGDDALVGAVVGSAGLAFYRSAYQFGQAPQSELTDVLNDVTFPTLAHVSDDNHALAVGYRRTLRLAATAVFPAAVGTALVAPTFVRAVLGLEWIPAVRPLQAIALAAVAQGLTATDKSLWQAVDRPDLLTKAKSLTLAVLAATAIPATFLYGTLGTAAAVAATAFLVAPVRAWFVARVLDASVREVTVPLAGPGIATLAMVAVVAPVVSRLPYTIHALAASVGIGVLAYVVAVLALDRTRLRTAAPLRDLLGTVRE